MKQFIKKTKYLIKLLEKDIKKHERLQDRFPTCLDYILRLEAKKEILKEAKERLAQLTSQS